MSTAEKKKHASIEEYLEYDASIEGKAEYYDGEIFDMAGGSPWHSLLTMNIGIAIGSRTKGSNCRAFSSDLRIFIASENAFVYPDFAIICGEMEFSLMDRNSLQNPQLVVEVVSPSTAAFDRAGKFERYATLPSLKEYVVVEQDTMLVHVFLKTTDDKWLLSRYSTKGQSVRFESIQVTVPIEEIYAGVDFPEL